MEIKHQDIDVIFDKVEKKLRISDPSTSVVLDFDFIEQGSEQGAPKYMEWFGAFALMVTLIWLYLEMLRLLSKLRSR